MTKIRAFTMLEALISLILTGIIIALSYSLFTIVNKQMALFEKENTEIINYNLFNTTLTLDMNQCNGFSFKNHQLTLKNYAKPNITYTFGDTVVTRTVDGLNSDTFQLHVISTTLLEAKTSQQHQLSMTLKLLNDTLTTHYFIKEPISGIINKNLFHED